MEVRGLEDTNKLPNKSHDDSVATERSADFSENEKINILTYICTITNEI